jgi:hypothetical protein
VLSEVEFSGLQARIQCAKYQKKNGTGYLVEEMTSHSIRATYVERKKRSNEIVDPFGGIQTVEWFEFISYPFSFERQSGILEITGTFRSVSPLIQQLGVLTNWKAAFEPLVLEPARMLDFLANEKVRFDVTFLDAVGLTLSVNASAGVRATGKSSVLKDLKRMVGGRAFTVSRVTIQVLRPEEAFEIDVSAAGKVIVEGTSPDYGVSLCRRAIGWTVERTRSKV